jgi:hypothetical protein
VVVAVSSPEELRFVIISFCFGDVAGWFSTVWSVVIDAVEAFLLLPLVVGDRELVVVDWSGSITASAEEVFCGLSFEGASDCCCDSPCSSCGKSCSEWADMDGAGMGDDCFDFEGVEVVEEEFDLLERRVFLACFGDSVKTLPDRVFIPR